MFKLKHHLQLAGGSLFGGRAYHLNSADIYADFGGVSAVVSDAEDNAILGDGDCSRPGESSRHIKSATEVGRLAFEFEFSVSHDAGAVPVCLAAAAARLKQGQALEVTALPVNGRISTGAARQPFGVGDIIQLDSLSDLLFAPFEGASGTSSAMILSAMESAEEPFVIGATFVVGLPASSKSEGAQLSRVPSAAPDPMAFGLLAALAASLIPAPAAGLPSSYEEAGKNESSEGDGRANLAGKADDAPLDPEDEGPLTTGAIPGIEAKPTQITAPQWRRVGSGTPPFSSSRSDHADSKPSINQPVPLPAEYRFTFPEIRPSIEIFAGSPNAFAANARSFDAASPNVAAMVVASPNAVAANTQSFDAASPNAAALDVATPNVVNDSSTTGPSTPLNPAPVAARPVAKNDGSYLLQHGRGTVSATRLLANDIVAPGLSLSIDSVSAAQHGVVNYNASTQEVTFVAAAGYRGNASFSYTVMDSEGRSANATVSLFVAPDENLFASDARPAGSRANDPNSVELGIRFVASSDGLITGLRYFKAADNGGVHTANLWGPSGTLLATATFQAESSSGWQQVYFARPVAIGAGITYTASYHTDGLYHADSGYYNNPVVNGDLTAVGSVFAYGASSNFPTNSFNGNNYWVDVVYSRPPVGPVAVDDDVGVIGNERSSSIASSSLLANDQSPDGLSLSVAGAGQSVNGTVSYDDATQSIIFTPTAGYTGAAGFSYSISDSFGGTSTANASVWVAGSQPSTLFGSESVPTIVKANDADTVELGFAFQSAVDGEIVGLRFYKGPDNIGPHVGNLWSATGDLLATVTYANETADGWQQVSFSTPVSVTAGVTYVASYHTNGNYSADPTFFSSSHTNGLLTAPANSPGRANGLYAYGDTSLFPTNSYNATGYGVDVLFKAHLTA